MNESNSKSAVLEERMTKLGRWSRWNGRKFWSSSFSLLPFKIFVTLADNFVSSTDLYGGTGDNWFQNTLKQLGIECRFVNPSKPEEFENAIDEKNKNVYMPKPSPNPKN